MSLSTDTKAKTVAQKLLPQLIKPQWNVPDKISLDPSKEMVVGRVVNKDHNVTGVMLHSPKLPNMLSRRHASIKYDNENGQWVVEDFKSLNGVYINDVKIESGVTVPMKNEDVVCFGVNIARNIFKFSLDGNVLKRVACSEEEDSQEPKPKKHPSRVKNQDQPLGLSTSVKNQSQKDSTGVKKNQDQSQNNSANQDQSSTRGKRSSESEHDGVTASKKLRLSDEDPTTSTTDHSHLQPSSHTKSSPSVSPALSGAASLKPSPALSLKSTPEMNMDVLFEGCQEEAEDTLNEAIFGSTDSKTMSGLLPESSTNEMDATAIQIQMAKKAMESEKHKLMSSIAALKSELAAKDQLLAKREEVEKKEKENENVISSMQEDFTCVICQELFINAYTLPCAHSFCEWCIKEWTKKKKQKNCPICRKTITSDPVHSLVLDNAIEKMVSKMSSEEKQERKKEEEQHKAALAGLASPPPPPPATTSSSAPRRGRSRGGATRARGRSTTARTGGGTFIRETMPEILMRAMSSYSASLSRDDPIVIDDDDDDDDDEFSGTSESSGSSVDGYSDAYYGGYGRCFNCGRRGHWAPGCPY